MVVYWFRRDLRIEDNMALFYAMQSGHKVLPIFIFDINILDELDIYDARVSFIYQLLYKLQCEVRKQGGSIATYHNNPLDVFKILLEKYDIEAVYCNSDYEPYSIHRDDAVNVFLRSKGVPFYSFHDHVIFSPLQILKENGQPYTVFTPYKRKWLSMIDFEHHLKQYDVSQYNWSIIDEPFLSLEGIGFKKSNIIVKDYDLLVLDRYSETRDIPAHETSNLGPHLRFGTISVREVVRKLSIKDQVFLSEIIWREFFMQILYHFPNVVNQSFKKKYDNINWMNNEAEFYMWTNGITGYPLIDAGMRELNATGYMHNRVRMVVAGFLCKHLLIDWRWGEAFFAKKLLDYELSSNNGNWQWAAGTGCDAAPYFRIFNPLEQLKKFDNEMVYVRKWIPEFGTPNYPKQIIDHSTARQRAIETYKKAL
ncbi:MAG: deoxyribodipyrimidine photo-lyase [Marinilabiliaceae bacterium]|nr:deoxyribodipyrimidine photo-lyase [Marinilabiliaceae bacterium]